MTEIMPRSENNLNLFYWMTPSDCFHFRYSIFPLRNDSIFFSLRET